MSSNRTQNQNAKGKEKGKGKEPAAPEPDTTVEQMRRNMENAKVRLVVVEALGGEQSLPADPVKIEMGKKKNHWALRLLLSHPIRYRKEGRIRTCSSVRASIEHPTGLLTCPEVTLKAMENDMETSISAMVTFYFDVLRSNISVRDFIAAADPLLPFRYVIVARSLDTTTDTAPAGRGSNTGSSGGRGPELSQHPNGCRDFTAQWFYLLHQAGFVAWEAQFGTHKNANIQPIQETEAFHHIIGYRYSPQRIDKAPICEAVFEGGYEREKNCTVDLVVNTDAGQRTKAGKYLVVLPYQVEQPPVQTFKRTLK